MGRNKKSYLTRGTIDPKTHFPRGLRRRTRDKVPVQDRDSSGYDELRELGFRFEEPEYAANIFENDPTESEKRYRQEPADYDDVLGQKTSHQERSDQERLPGNRSTRVPGDPPETGAGVSEWSAEHLNRDSVGIYGYFADDDRIRGAITRSLAKQPDIAAGDIEVDVSEGKVTLEGVVPSSRDKHEAEDLALSIAGVREVMNHLRVEP